MKYVLTFLISMLPIFELRGGIIFAVGSGMPFYLAFIIAFIGNIFPIPFILLFLRKIFTLLEKNKYTKKIVTKLINKARRNHEKLGKYELLGIYLLVAIPLPLTGAYTGALVAAVFDFRIKKALPVISAGVFTAGLIMLALSCFVKGLFF